jgi:hypothetical protein
MVCEEGFDHSRADNDHSRALARNSKKWKRAVKRASTASRFRERGCRNGRRWIWRKWRGTVDEDDGGGRSANFHQGQRSCAPRKQAGHMSALDPLAENVKKPLAPQGPSTHGHYSFAVAQ